jgi:ferredoxin
VYRLPESDGEDVEILFTDVPPELEGEASAGARVCPVAAILISQ